MSGFWRSPYIGAVEAFGRCADNADITAEIPHGGS
jgi:hypothetical protein